MPKILSVRAPLDEKEERWVRKMAASRHGPADWIVHAKTRREKLGWGASGGDCRGVGME